MSNSGSGSDSERDHDDPCGTTVKRRRLLSASSASATESASNVSSTCAVSINGKQVRRKFQNSWLQLPEFKSWLIRVSGDDQSAKCTVCNVVFSGYGKSDLQKHAKGKKHLELSLQIEKAKQQHNSIDNMLSVDVEVKRTEAILCCFIAERNLPLSLVEPLFDMVKSLPAKHVLQKVRLGKQKATNVIRQGLAPYFQERFLAAVSSRPFTLYVDETTDIAGIKQLAVMLSCTSKDTLALEVGLLDIVPCPDATALGIFKSIEEVLKAKNIDMSNWAGFCADTTNAMFGAKHSVSSLIKQKYPSVVLVKCTCHMLHLAASYACGKLSQSLEDTCRNIYNHFRKSYKSSSSFMEFQVFAEVKPSKILRPGQTRWLSLQACVKRILEQWSALTLYWTNVAMVEDKTHANQLVLNTLNNPLMRCLMEFLEQALDLFNECNTLFQSDLPLFCKMKKEVGKLLQTLALNFMERSYVLDIDPKSKQPRRSPFDIDPLQVDQYVSLKKVYLGLNASTTLQECEASADPSEVEKVFVTARNFYIEAIQQIKGRFNMTDAIHEDISFLDPSNARAVSPQSVVPIAKKYVGSASWSLDMGKLDSEWRDQSLCFVDCEDHVQYWQAVFETKNQQGENKFTELPKLVQFFMCLPISNASIERLFSKVKLIKNERRNSLSNESLTALLQVQGGMSRENFSSHEINLNKDLLRNFRNITASSTAKDA